MRPLRSANYIVAEEWTAGDEEGIRFDFPFSINISWSELDL
ncbi:hypothetical protein [Nocardia nova]|nr:hypothetical protein [Nocardia nova]